MYSVKQTKVQYTTQLKTEVTAELKPYFLSINTHQDAAQCQKAHKQISEMSQGECVIQACSLDDVNWLSLASSWC